MSASEEAPLPDEQPEERETGPCATFSEKLARMQALTEEEYKTLERWAIFVALKFRGGNVNDAEARDLLHSALVQSLKDSRTWQPKRNTYMEFVGNCIRNIGWAWFIHGRRSVSMEDENTLPPIDPERQIKALNTLAKVEEDLSDRPLALEILDLKMQGITAREIQERLGITLQKYDETRVWIRRTLIKEGYRS